MCVEFLTTLCALYSFINTLYIELLRNRNIFKGGGGGGGGNKLVFGVRGNPRASLNETRVCVDSPVFFCVFILLAEVLLPGYT